MSVHADHPPPPPPPTAPWSPRRQLLITWWSAISTTDRQFLVEMHEQEQETTTGKNHGLKEMSGVPRLEKREHEQELDLAKEEHGDKGKKGNNVPTTSKHLRRHCIQSNQIDKQETETWTTIASLETDIMSDKTETGYSKSRLFSLVQQHRVNTEPTAAADAAATSDAPIDAATAATTTTTASDDVLDNKPCRSSNLKRSLQRQLTSASTTSKDDGSTKKDRSIMTENEQDEIVYRLLTQDMILEHARNDGGYCGKAMATVFPFFSPEAVSLRAKMTETCIMILVCMNVAAVIITTEEPWFHTSSSSTGSSSEQHPNTFLVIMQWFELFSFIVFSVEYLLRMWVCVLDEKYALHGNILGRMRYSVSYNAIIDLIALIPSLIEWMDTGNTRNVGTGLRLWRVVRIMKLEHYSRAFATLQGGFDQQGKLWRLVLIYPCVALILFSTLLSFTETLENGADVETVRVAVYSISIVFYSVWCVSLKLSLSPSFSLKQKIKISSRNFLPPFHGESRVVFFFF